jgi:UDP:flavonoid glycosyltransferase YjiC (YdhE family)
MGDIQPFVALAAELKSHGHQPVLALAPMYRAYVIQLGFEFVPIGPALDYQELQRKDTQNTLRGISPMAMFRGSLEKLSGMLPQMMQELKDICRDADVLISGHLQPVARILHELTQLPFVSIHTNHFGGMQPTAYRQVAASVINPFRARYGLRPLIDPIHTDANSPQLALYAISRYMRQPSADWPSHYHIIGFFFLEDRGAIPDPELVRFLADGEAPVVISFGSVAHPDPIATTNLLLEAIQRAGCRAVIQHGWSGLAKGGKLPPNVLGIGFVQHTWLFPRAACIVHAGGSGTPATTLRSGIPAVVIPHIGDQPMWAELVRGLGCARDVIPYKELTATRLAAALVATLNDPLLYRRAGAVAEKIRDEQGVTKARLLIEQLLLRAGKNPLMSSPLQNNIFQTTVAEGCANKPNSGSDPKTLRLH